MCNILTELQIHPDEVEDDGEAMLIWDFNLDRASGRSRKKKSNFAGFLGANSRKKRPISQEFHGNFRGQFR